MPDEADTGTVIQQHVTAMVTSALAESRSLGDLAHPGTKGRLRELICGKLLRPFLAAQIGIGSGTIINLAGVQSNETDIILDDNRVLPPFILLGDLGVYPIEAVVATVEVKSILDKAAIEETAEKALTLCQDICSPRFSIYDDMHFFLPLNFVFGFTGSVSAELADQELGARWLAENCKALMGLCLPGSYSWMLVRGFWRRGDADEATHDEVKRFMGILADNVHASAQRRIRRMGEFHRDWVGVYIREQRQFD